MRHHPIEYLITAAFYWLAVVAFGIPVIVVTSHAVAVFTAAAIIHGNIRLPEWLEPSLQPVVITLDLHLIHHSVVSAEANSNYGAVLSIWDRLFGTYLALPGARAEQLVFGVRELPAREMLKPSAMLLVPWRVGRASASGAAGP